MKRSAQWSKNGKLVQQGNCRNSIAPNTYPVILLLVLSFIAMLLTIEQFLIQVPSKVRHAC